MQTPWQQVSRHARLAPRWQPGGVRFTGGTALSGDRTDSIRQPPRVPLREHVANSVRRYIGDLNGSGTDNLYEIALRELEIPLFVEVLEHCDGNQSRAAAMLGIHRATLRKKLRDYGIA
jgi:Fis family transcriptional regulator